MSERVSEHYDDKYFSWQESIGRFGGWANQTKFAEFISSESRVLDFGCGGGFLLKNLQCSKRIGIEINPAAAECAKRNDIEVYGNVADVPDEYVDVIISDNALEHTLQPLQELKLLLGKLRLGGKIIFVVPCDSISFGYKPNDINRHLFSWSPMNLGNLFTEAGYSVIESRPYKHKWPPKYETIAKIGGRKLFDAACRIYARIERSWYQVRIVAEKTGTIK